MYLASERRWLLGPLEGWVVFTLLILAVLGWLVWGGVNLRPKSVCPTPCPGGAIQVAPSPAVAPTPAPAPVAASPVIIHVPSMPTAPAPAADLSLIERGLREGFEQIADSFRQSPQPTPLTVETPQRRFEADLGSAAERARRLEEWARQP